jgi:hypothetical protein
MTTTDKATERAEILGARAGQNAAQWAIQDLWEGRATRGERECAESVLRQLDEGDARIYDSFTLPDLSGEWAGDPTPHTLFEDCTGYEYFPDIDDHHETLDELCTTWEQAVSDAFFSTLEESARKLLSEEVTA